MTIHWVAVSELRAPAKVGSQQQERTKENVKHVGGKQLIMGNKEERIRMTLNLLVPLGVMKKTKATLRDY